MVYLVIAAIAVGAAVAVGVIIVLIYLNVCSRCASQGKSSFSSINAKRIKDGSLVFLAIITVAAMAVGMLYAQEKCLGLTAGESFNRYLSQCGYTKEDYYEEDCGNYSFYVSKDDRQAEEEWLAYGRNGMFFSRVYSANRTVIIPCNSDGTLWANAVEFKTSKGYFYYLSFYENSVFNRVQTNVVVFNGLKVYLTGGKYIVSEEALSTLSVVD